MNDATHETALPFNTMTGAWDVRRERLPLDAGGGVRIVAPPQDARAVGMMEWGERDAVVEWLRLVDAGAFRVECGGTEVGRPQLSVAHAPTFTPRKPQA